MPKPDAYDRAAHRALAYQTFRRGLRRLEEVKDELHRAIAMLERADHPLGPITDDAVNETTAERLGFTPAQQRELERRCGLVECDW